MIDPIDDEVSKVRGSSFISGVGEEQGFPKVDSGRSSIEKSKEVRPEIVPLANIPILIVPSNQESAIFAVASLDTTGQPTINMLHSLVLKNESEIKQSALEKWTENLREIREHIAQLLASPVYQQLQEIQLKGDPYLANVSGVQGVTSAHAAVARGEQVEFLSTLDRLQVLERIPSSGEVSDTSAPQDSTQMLVVPLAAGLLLGGGIAVGTELVHSAPSLAGTTQLIEQLQPVFSTMAVQDVVPLINLMVVSLIYSHSWNEAISNKKNSEQQSHVPVIQNFAKDVIKIVVDPHFIQATLIPSVKGAEHLSPRDQDRLASMMKLVLIGVALSLLYSVEVGKVQRGKFGGIEAEELRNLLMGEFTDLPDPGKKPTLQEQLTASLIQRAWEQLQLLSVEDKVTTIDLLLSYLTESRDLDSMLDPAKVFDETNAAAHFDPKDKIGMVKA